MTRPKDIGTAHTTAIIRYLTANGFPHAELRNQAGAHDKGDITGTPGICWEAKGGKAAENASDGQVEAWLAETERERINARADVGILVMKRKGIGVTNAGRYWAVMQHWQFAQLSVGVRPLGRREAPVRSHLSDAVLLLRDTGYGSPLEELTA